MKNITLIGMPGAGKSTTGVVLAKTLGMQFIDTDLLIQTTQQKQLQEIINEQGIEPFLQIENDVIRKLQTENSVIATGGSVIFGPEAMQNLKQNSLILYIQLPIQTIKQRLSNIQTRGIAMAKGRTIEDVYQERIPLYEQHADIILPAEGKNLEETVALMVQKLHEKGWK